MDKVSKYFDDEAEKSGEGHTDDENDKTESPTVSDTEFIDDTEIPDDTHLHRLKRFKDIFHEEPNSPPGLKQTPNSDGNQKQQMASNNHDTVNWHTANDDAVTTTTATPVQPLNVASMLTPVQAPVATPETTVLKEGYRLRANNIMLTWPQCTVDKETMSLILQGKLMKYNPKYIIVSHEFHNETGGDHLHATISTSKKMQIRDATDYFKYANFIPHIDINIRSPEAVIKYVCKDKDYIVWPETFKPLETKKKKPSTVSAKIVNDINEGATIQDIYYTHPSFMVLHSHQIETFYNAYQEFKDQELQKEKWEKVKEFSGVSLNDRKIATWMTTSLCTNKHVFGTKNLWIWGKPGLGKTSITQLLKSVGCNVYCVDMSTHFYDGLKDTAQLIVYDEFKGQRTITDMNLVAGGGECRLDVKCSTFRKSRPTPVLVLSNYNIGEAYAQARANNPDRIDTLIRRFTIIEVTHWIRLTVIFKDGTELTTAEPIEE